MDTGEEVSGGLVVAGRNCSVLLEPTIEVLHEVAGLVYFLVVEALNLSIALGRNDECFSCREQRFDHALVGIEGFIRQQGFGPHVRQQRIGAFQIMGLAGRQEEGQRIAKGVDHCMDFGAQSAFAAPDRLVLAVFF